VEHQFWPILIMAGLLALAAFILYQLLRSIRNLVHGHKPVRVYVAGPYSQGDPEANTYRAMAEADKLLAAGYCPYLPHLSHFHHLQHPHDYETWMRLDFAYLAVCDVLIRIPGPSPGADREVKVAKERGIPVYYSVAEFLEECSSPSKRSQTQ